MKQIFIIFALTVLRTLVNCNNNEEIHHRDKRYLVFYNGGTFKLVLSVAIPVKFTKYQAIALAWNLQFQYPVPTNATQFFQSYPPIVKRSIDDIDETTSDRYIFYKGIEKLLDKEGLNGKECLLRTICENAFESTFHDANGLYGEIIHIILSPDYGEGDINNDLDNSYFEAQRAGIFGVDCNTLYTDCNLKNGVLGLISKIQSYI